MPYGRSAISDDCVQGEHGGTDDSDEKTWKAWVIAGKICQHWFNHIALRYAERHVGNTVCRKGTV